MSSPSIGVTKVVLTRWTISWVILSPSCSASRISRARPPVVGPALEHLLRAAARRAAVFWPARLKRSKKTRSRGNERGQLHGRESTGRRGRRRRARPPCPSHFSGGCGRSRGRRGEQRRDLGDPLGRQAEQRVGAGADRDRALGVVAQGEAGDAEVGRLLLDPAGVGQHRGRVGLEREEVEVADRVDQRDARRRPRSPSILRVRGWTGKSDRHLARRPAPAPRSPRRAAGRRRAPGGAG